MKSWIWNKAEISTGRYREQSPVAHAQEKVWVTLDVGK